jgi:6-phosphogluconolactonase
MTFASSAINVEVLVDPDALARCAADWMLALAAATKGVFAVALSGGATPKRLYETLARPPFRDSFPWSRTHLFWGDERFVPHGDALSNYRMAREAMISKVGIPPTNVHAVPTEGLTPYEAASAYEAELKSFYGADALNPLRPFFDISLLGLGPDGHTASLFPHTTVLEERDHWVAAVIGAKAEARITLTYPFLESSRNTVFLVTGEEKRSIFDRLVHGDTSFPAARLRPVGTVRAFVDAAAMAGSASEDSASQG